MLSNIQPSTLRRAKEDKLRNLTRISTGKDIIGKEGEVHKYLDASIESDPKVLTCIRQLIHWVNEQLADQGIVVKDIQNDLFDGQIFQKLLEKLGCSQIQLHELIQSSSLQRKKVEIVVIVVRKMLRQPIDSSETARIAGEIYGKQLLPILKLLVEIACHFQAPVSLPDNVQITEYCVTFKDGKRNVERIVHDITGQFSSNNDSGGNDAFDQLFYEKSPEKLKFVESKLCAFATKHLLQLSLDVTDISHQFTDGVFLIFLMGLLEGYYVPACEYHMTCSNFDEKVHNVRLAFSLMEEAGIPIVAASPEDIVNGHLKRTLRLLFNLFIRYKSL